MNDTEARVSASQRGYAPFVPLALDRRAEVVAEIVQAHHPVPPARILVVGCGSGREAAVVGQALRARVTGIDLKGEFDEAAMRVADLRVADAMRLPFSAATFDFVYSYHALEHFSDPAIAIGEMKRILRPAGGFFIGTPNRRRIIGYIGGGARLREKIEWNFADYRARWKGRFRNELGAHAGFSSNELCSMLARGFDCAPRDVTTEYYRRLYRRQGPILHLLEISGTAQFAFPSVYFVGRIAGGS